jgi:hypothetical protein
VRKPKKNARSFKREIESKGLFRSDAKSMYKQNMKKILIGVWNFLFSLKNIHSEAEKERNNIIQLAVAL